MYFLLRAVVSVAALLLMFWGMVSAFHLLNLPSNLAVVAGVCLLLLIAAGGFVVFNVIWKWNSSNRK